MDRPAICLGTGGSQWIASPALRVHYRWRRHSRIELEVGGEWSNRDLPTDLMTLPATDDTVEISTYFVSLGYWMDF